MKTLKLSVLILAILAAFWVTPAFAQGGDSDNLVCTGHDLTLRSGETANSIAAFGCDVNIESGAVVTRDVAAFGGNVSIAGHVQRSVVAFGGNIDLASTAVVDRDVLTFGGNLNRAEGAVVRGSFIRNPTSITRFGVPVPPVRPFVSNSVSSGVRAGIDFGAGLLSALAFAVLGVLLVIFAPEQTRRVHAAAQAAPWGSIGVGCLTLLLLPFLMVLLVITLVGIPIALLLLLVVAAAWFFGWIAIGWLAGERILEAFRAREVLPIVAVVLGVVLLGLVSRIPVVGWIVWLAVTLLGLGAVVLTRFGTRVYPHPATVALAPMGAAGNPPPTTTSIDIARVDPHTDIDRPPSER